jgi:RND family efflux transporter MFP subunit
MKKTKYVLPLLIMVMIWASGCSEKNKNNNSGQPISVKILPANTGAEGAQYYVGTIEESASIPLSFSVSGTVKEVYVSEGQSVKKGQLLASLSGENYQSAYQMAVAKENQAKDGYKRLTDLYKKGSLPEVKYVEIQTNLEQAKSSRQIAEQNLNDCKLYASTDGVIGKRMIEPGSNVLPMNAVFNLVKIEKVKVKVSIPEKEINQISVGQTAKICLSALGNAYFTGKVVEKGVVANAISHTYDVKLEVVNSQKNIMPGMVCNVYLTSSKSVSNILVPQRAIQINADGKKFVFIADTVKNKVVKRLVETGNLSSDGVEVVQGLQLGEPVIVEGYQNIDENSNIKVLK